MTLDTRTAVVTGGTKRVGRGVAHALAQAGARVFVTDRSAENAGGGSNAITAIRCDHRQDADVDAAFARVLGDAGAIDVLVNNVWGGYDNMMENGQFTSPRSWRHRRCSRGSAGSS